MLVYRITQAQHANDISGAGGLYGNSRFHKKGRLILYASQHVSLAAVEYCRKARIAKPVIPYRIMTIEIPDDVKMLVLKDMDVIADKTKALAYGMKWLNEGKYMALKVRSVMIPQEYNFVLNPAHPRYREVKLVKTEPFVFDARMWTDGNK